MLFMLLIKHLHSQYHIRTYKLDPDKMFLNYMACFQMLFVYDTCSKVLCSSCSIVLVIHIIHNLHKLIIHESKMSKKIITIHHENMPILF